MEQAQEQTRYTTVSKLTKLIWHLQAVCQEHGYAPVITSLIPHPLCIHTACMWYVNVPGLH